MRKRFKRGERFQAFYEGHRRDFIYAKYKSKGKFFAILINKLDDIWIADKIVVLNKTDL